LNSALRHNNLYVKVTEGSREASGSFLKKEPKNF